MESPGHLTVAAHCPFLRPVMADQLWLYPMPAYCRPPAGRVRIPSANTMARVCAGGRYGDCPAYRSRIPPETARTRSA